MSETTLPLTLPSQPPHRPLASWAAAQTMTSRSWRLQIRQIDGLLASLALPIMVMLVSVVIFSGAIHTGVSYVDYVVPGVLMICVGFGAGTTAVSVAHDLTGTIVDRFRSMDVPAPALIGGHVVTGVARNLLSTTLVFGLAFAIGFRSHTDIAGWLAVAAILALYMLAISWLAAAVGIATRSAEAANGIAFFLSFLAYPSSAIVPISTMPGWLQGFAEAQPVTQVVDTVRRLLSGTAVGASAWQAVAWSLAIVAASVTLTVLLFRRRTR
jgi:ABC-2 type transport system permease protein